MISNHQSRVCRKKHKVKRFTSYITYSEKMLQREPVFHYHRWRATKKTTENTGTRERQEESLGSWETTVLPPEKVKRADCHRETVLQKDKADGIPEHVTD